MIAFIQKLIHQGTNENFADGHNRRLIYTNIIYITLPLVYTLFVLIDIPHYLKPIHELQWDQFIFIVEIVICIASLYLNRIGHSKAGRLLFILSWPLLMHIIPIWYQKTPSDYYLAYPVGLIFHALLIHLMFSRRKEAALFWPLLILNFVLVLTSISLLLKNEDNPTPELVALVNDKYYYLVIILYYLLFSLLIFLLIQAIEYLFIDIAKANQVIQEQKEEVTAINEELTQSNHALTRLNEEVNSLNQNLEGIIAKRTEELAQKNERLTEYAFYNAHKLRAPFCRIKGLLQLKAISTPEEQKQIDSLVQTELEDLDKLIREIQRIVSE
jgi:signal transduction histidine kinase